MQIENSEHSEYLKDWPADSGAMLLAGVQAWGGGGGAMKLLGICAHFNAIWKPIWNNVNMLLKHLEIPPYFGKIVKNLKFPYIFLNSFQLFKKKILKSGISDQLAIWQTGLMPKLYDSKTYLYMLWRIQCRKNNLQVMRGLNNRPL